MAAGAPLKSAFLAGAYQAENRRDKKRLCACEIKYPRSEAIAVISAARLSFLSPSIDIFRPTHSAHLRYALRRGTR